MEIEIVTFVVKGSMKLTVPTYRIYRLIVSLQILFGTYESTHLHVCSSVCSNRDDHIAVFRDQRVHVFRFVLCDVAHISIIKIRGHHPISGQREKEKDLTKSYDKNHLQLENRKIKRQHKDASQ